MKRWFTSDSHWAHANILKYCDRPFKDVYQMNEEMIWRWNNVVGKDDEVYHLGDFGFGKPGNLINIMQQLNGKIFFIRGNHDKTTLEANKKIHRFEWVKDYHLLKIEDAEVSDGYQYLFLCHYPMLSWNHSHRGSWQMFGDYPVLNFNDINAWDLYGHHHGSLSNKPKLITKPCQMDVGVDVWDFTPISYEKVKEVITKQNMNA